MIKGITDRGASFPRIGELRKGAEKTGNAPGKDLEYFRFTSDDAGAVKAFEDAYGKEPRTIRCYLPYKDVEANFGTFMEEWLAGGLVRRCDGENIQIERSAKGYNKEPHACKKEQPGGCKCKQVGRLIVIVPELRRFAYVVALTTSIHDIIELHGNLTAAMEIRGDLRGIPFILSRRPREISMPDKDGKRVRREKWLLSIEPAPAWVQAQIEQLPQFEEPALLPAPDEDGVIEGTAKPEPQKPTTPPQPSKAPQAPATPAAPATLADIVKQAQDLIDNPPKLWPQSTVEAVRDNWLALRASAATDEIDIAELPQGTRISGYLQAIVTEGTKLQAHREAVAASEAQPA